MCIGNLILLDKGNGQCVEKGEIQENQKYYLINSTHAGTCSNDIPYCVSCDKRNNCLKCKDKYIYDENQNKCVSNTTEKKKESKRENNRIINNEGYNFFSIKNIILLNIIYIVIFL